MNKAKLRDLVILLPGISGSVLQKNGTDIWGMSAQALWSFIKSRGNSLHELMLHNDEIELDHLGDGVTATRLMSDVSIIPGIVKIDGYSHTADMIRACFQTVEDTDGGGKPANFIQFPYDWRRDNRGAARQLQRLIDDRLSAWRKYSGADDAKVIVVAHSMGGLIARYYLEVLDGWQNCKLLISMGTPYRGSLNALNFLANGYKKMGVDMTEPLRSFTSMYQLLPTYPAIKVGTLNHRISDLEVSGVDRARAENALAFHREIREAVEKHRGDVLYRDKGYRIVPIVGVCQETLQSAELLSDALISSPQVPIGVDPLFQDGDGTVPRVSGVPVELSEEFREVYVAERHSSLQCNEFVLTQIRKLIERSQVSGWENVRGPGADAFAQQADRPSISLDLDDLYLPNESKTFRVCILNASDDVTPPESRISSVEGMLVATKRFWRDNDEWVMEADELLPGVYRIEVQAGAGLEAPLPVHDVFAVTG